MTTETGPVVIALAEGGTSGRTLEWGLAEARLRFADVVLVHVGPDPGKVIALGWYPLEADVRRDVAAQRHLTAVTQLARSRAPSLTVRSRLLRGAPVPVLQHQAVGARMLVVGVTAAGPAP
ncbi:universal stress protein [Cellulomonas endophytica]|uniref:universal stress protein n=1 Tax=Cellulomonas endophytica TaxID=2494735 RepID=UPI001012F464|nr:universal stress protein [Cellulomonas endophytica]